MTASRYQINALTDEYATDPFWNKDPQVTYPSIKSGSNYIPCFMSVVFATLPCNIWKFISLYDTNECKNSALNAVVGIAKTTFVKFVVKYDFDVAELRLKSYESRSYLTGTTTDKLRCAIGNQCFYVFFKWQYQNGGIGLETHALKLV